MSEKTIKLDKNQKEKVNALIIALNGALPLSDEWKIYQKVTKIYSDISELYKLDTEHVNEEYINKYDNVAYHNYYDELNTTLDELIIKNPSIKNLDPVKKYLEQKSGQISGGSRKKSRSTNVTKKKANKRSRSKNTIKKRRTSRKSVKKSKSKKTNKK